LGLVVGCLLVAQSALAESATSGSATQSPQQGVVTMQRGRGRPYFGRGISHWMRNRRRPVANVLAAIGSPLGRRLPETRGNWQFRNVPAPVDPEMLSTTPARRTPPQATFSGQAVREGDEVYILNGQDKVLVEGPARDQVKKVAGQQVRVSGMLTVNEAGAMVMHGKHSETVDPAIRPAAANAPMDEQMPEGMGTGGRS
jgi:hypothetical protein